MNAPFQTAHELTATTSMLPVEFEVLAPPPLLLPGERLDQYQALRQAIFAELSPRSAIEWLLAIDVAELSWEIQRYRLLRHRLLVIYRQKAIEAALRSIDLAGIAPEFADEAEYHTRQNALSWRLSPSDATEIEARLASYGFDQHSINADVYVQAREVFVLFESLLNAAQTRRLLLIREIKRHRILD
ncbi:MULTISPECIES: hypothetical protein [Bradyrhizobium]|uniref:Uncharacterized protein n=1 Tax=Bradyrhizobium brasilense TaxID=1419277 RepID=A0A1G7A0Y5_9BRAD|nr:MULTISPECIES: hypothetical protein [Bradyrhizobium]MCA6104662.1 hypothetical protein [Bradyrhizobium australafricanum]MCC8971774.1 hypothetical protein [Bradyrhizobium brasilense]SDE08598.1 hypothetical protein SAMN05216337_1019141 [Bradyrhizobium brasilense]